MRNTILNLASGEVLQSHSERTLTRSEGQNSVSNFPLLQRSEHQRAVHGHSLTQLVVGGQAVPSQEEREGEGEGEKGETLERQTERQQAEDAKR